MSEVLHLCCIPFHQHPVPFYHWWQFSDCSLEGSPLRGRGKQAWAEGEAELPCRGNKGFAHPLELSGAGMALPGCWNWSKGPVLGCPWEGCSRGWSSSLWLKAIPRERDSAVWHHQATLQTAGKLGPEVDNLCGVSQLPLPYFPASQGPYNPPQWPQLLIILLLPPPYTCVCIWSFLEEYAYTVKDGWYLEKTSVTMAYFPLQHF